MNNGRMIFGVVLIFLGLTILFNIDFMRFLLPAIFIFLGLRMLSRDSDSDKRDFVAKDETNEDKIDYSVTFSGLERKVVTDNFQGGKINAVFGGGTLDLREAKIEKGETAKLEINAVFGGFKVIVPPTWLVSSSVVGVIGGFSNSTKAPSSKSEEGRLVVSGTAVFGGGEIVN